MVTPLFLALNGCATKIANNEWCGSLASQGAACFYQNTSDSEMLSLQQWAVRWDNLADPVVCTQTSSFASLKAEIETLCSNDGDCTYDTTVAIWAISDKLNELMKKHKDKIKEMLRDPQ